jgi:hypothetical protein
MISLKIPKGVIRNRKSKMDRQHNGYRIKKKGQTTSSYTTHNPKDRVKWTPHKTGDELICPWRLGSSCSTGDTCRANLVTKPVISHEWGKDTEVFTTNRAFPWLLLIHMFHSGQPSHGGDHKCNDFNLAKMNSWFSRFFDSSNSLSRKS